MTMISIEAHPVSWQMAFNLLDQKAPGPGKAMTNIRTQEAIAEKAHPGVLWPNPFTIAMSPKDREEEARQTGKTLDPSLRVAVSLSPEQADFLRDQIKKYVDEPGTKEQPQAPGLHARMLMPILKALEAPRE